VKWVTRNTGNGAFEKEREREREKSLRICREKRQRKREKRNAVLELESTFMPPITLLFPLTKKIKIKD